MEQQKKSGKVVNRGIYQISYEKINQQEVNVTVCNVQSQSKYAMANVVLKNINFKGFEEAVNGGNKNFTLEIKQVVEKKDQQQENINVKYVQLIIGFSTILINRISENVTIPFHSQVSISSLYKADIARLHQRLIKVSQKNRNNKKLIVKTIQEIQFKSEIDPNYGYDGSKGNESDYDMVKLFDINLPEFQKYQIQISMLVKCTSTYWYFYSNNNYQSPLSNGLLSIPISNQYFPITISFVLNNRIQQQKNHQFYTYDIVDYPFIARNLVVTATKISN